MEKTSTIQTFRRSQRLSDLVSAYDGGVVRGDGDRWTVRCPMPDHDDKTPSFSILDGGRYSGVFNCFGCGVKGNGLAFVNRTDPERWRALLGERAARDPIKALFDDDHVPTVAPPRGGATRDMSSTQASRMRETQVESGCSKDAIMAANEKAVEVFRANLSTGFGREDALSYLYLDRALMPETVKAFGIGYTPGFQYNETIAQIRRKGVDVETLKAAGIAKISDKGRPYPFFRDRVTIRWPDAEGRAVAIGARLLPDRARSASQTGNYVPPKYLNSATTPVFEKGKTLFNLDKVKLGEDGRLLVVEGYFDVISLHQAGIREVVSPIGVALSREQLALLWKMTDSPIICLDGDKAGSKASMRAAELAQSIRPEGKSLRFALLPDGKDPDDIVRAGGAETFEKAIATIHTLEQLLERRDGATLGIREAGHVPIGKRKAPTDLTDEAEEPSRKLARLEERTDRSRDRSVSR